MICDHVNKRRFFVDRYNQMGANSVDFGKLRPDWSLRWISFVTRWVGDLGITPSGDSGNSYAAGTHRSL